MNVLLPATGERSACGFLRPRAAGCTDGAGAGRRQSEAMTDQPARAAAVDLYWLPLGAGGHSVRLNGKVFEAIAARLQRRPVCDLYHSALEVRLDGGRVVIEMAPA